MVLLTADKLEKSYTEKKLLNDTGFSINSGEKIGIVGVNGTGKTTLLKIIAGKEELDKGTIFKANGLKIGYLSQNPEFTPDFTVLQQVLSLIDENMQQAKEFECKSILTKLKITDFDEKMSLLSGGQRKRVALACALVTKVDLLILDEPTNHIDAQTIIWLENYLENYKGALLMVTHDRYFLDRVTNKILEIDKGKIYSYSCNYTNFLQRKAQREESLVANERKRQSLIKREVEWILQGPCARGTKSQYRIDRLKELQEKKVDLTNKKIEMSSMNSRLGNKIIEIENISKSFENKKLFNDFSYMLLRNDRIGIVGENGVGKSTFIKILMGVIAPSTGNISLGTTLKIGYFSQETDEMDENLRVIDYIKQDSNAIETINGTLTASQLLETFLFFQDLQYTTISRLSGGERRRLFLLKILSKAPNILILDEPTNDLDIETLTILEDYLKYFKGAVIMVSHDRYFLDKVAQTIFAFENQNISIYSGGYTDYLIQTEDNIKPIIEKEKIVKPKEKSSSLKFSYNEMREFESIDATIETLETEIGNKDKEISKNGSCFETLEKLLLEKSELEEKLEYAMERWVYLNDLNNKINNK